MKFYIYANYLKEFNFYDNVHVEKVDCNNYATGTIRAIKICKDKSVIGNLVHKELHCLGSFDDETGEIVPEKKLLVSYDDYIKVVEVSPEEMFEGVKNVQGCDKRD